MSDDEIHDTSRVDAFMAARRRAMVLHAVWRPMLAGAAGAALVIAAVWVTLPRVSYREIEVPKVTMRDVTVPNIVPRDVTVDHVVPHDTVIEIPRIVSPEEKRFIDSPAFAAAEIKGRIVPSVDGIALSFDTGKNWYPADASRAADSAAYVGDWGFCSPTADKTIFHCFALHHGTTVSVPQKPAEGRQA